MSAESAAAMTSGTASPADVPLCVDCDGTLIHSDLLHESALRLVKRSVLQALRMPFWFLQGKARAKERLAGAVDLDPAWLPYNEPFVDFLRAEKARGRRLVLATASPVVQAQAVADHIGVFDEVVATAGGINLKGASKAERLIARFGEKGFDYAGNDGADVPVWKAARQAIVVNADGHTLDAARSVASVSRVFEGAGGGFLDMLRALRLHQWLKNILVFLPLLAAHRQQEAALVVDALLAFLAFGLCASSVYVVNDLLDLPADRAHDRKRSRPFASGKVSILRGTLMVPVLLAGAAAIAALLNPLYQLCLFGYLVLTTLYSLWLKNQVVVDVMLLAALYTSRVIAGAAATLIRPSFWLLAFSMFLFLSLAIIKRYSEMLVVLRSKRERAAGRGYTVHDLPVLMGLGTASGYCSVMVLALYVNSPDVGRLYPDRLVLWLLLPPFLYWISRAWMKTHRGEMHDDPVVFAARDWQSLVIAALIAAILVAATVL